MEKKLKDLFEIKKGKKEEEQKVQDNESVRYIQIEDLRTDENIKFCKVNSKSTFVNPDNIIIAWDGANAGTIGYGLKGVIGSTLARLEPREEGFSTDYVGKYLQSKLRYLKDNCTGATIPHINRKVLENLLVSLPLLKTQKKIVEILDKAQELVDLRKKQIKMLDELIKSIFYDMFGDPVINPKGWGIKRLNECSKINPRKSEVGDISDIQVSFVPMSNVSEKGDLDLSERRNIDEVYKSYTYFKDGDVLFAKITPCMENGKGCIASNLLNGIGFGSTEFHVIRPDQSLVKSDFLYYLTMTENFRMAAERKMTGSAGQKRVPAVYLKNYNLITPPIKLQNQFAEKVQKIEEQKELMQESLTEMQNNFNSLMQKAFKGELFN